MKQYLKAILFRKNGTIATFLSLAEKQEIPIMVDDQTIKKLKRGKVYQLEKTSSTNEYQLVVDDTIKFTKNDSQKFTRNGN